MNIRLANRDDDKKVLAQLIYETDRFIYPYWFSDKNEGINVIAELLENENSIFYYKNCVVAEIDGQIVGLIMFYKNNGSFKFDYNKYILLGFESEHVINNYVLKAQQEIIPNTAYVFAVRVKDEYKRQGIACKMFEYVFSSLPKNYTIEIDVLVENTPAVNLYKKVGFEIINEYKGYNGYKKHKPPCYFMRKK